MEIAPLHPREEERLRSLLRYRILDTAPEVAFDDITAIASHICRTPIALVSLVDTDRQWFKSRRGLDAAETSRDDSFCSHAILQTGIFQVQDTQADERFADNPLVVADPSIRFYAGAPLITEEQLPLGTLCVIDRVPRRLSDEQMEALTALSRQVMSQLELRKSLDVILMTRDELRRSHEELKGLSTVISHDLHEPLLRIRRRSGHLVSVAAESDTPAHAEIIRIHDDAERMHTLLEGLEAVTRVQDRSPFREVELRGVVDRAREKVGLDESEVEIGELPVIEASPGQIEQMFLALFRNADLYRREDEPLRVRVEAVVEDGDPALPRTLGTTAHITVSDNGVGFQSGDAERIFRAFERGSAQDRVPGVGMGLSICRRIAERHGGAIWAESPEPTGATFHVVLPVRQDGRVDVLRAA